MEKLKSIPNSVKEIIQILEQEKILVPENFSEEVLKNAEAHNGSRIPSITAIAAIIRICNYWKPYVLNETEFSKLVINKIYSMARVGASVIRSNRIEEDKSYIADICNIKNEANLPKCTITIATQSGHCKIQKGFGSSLKEF